MILVAVLRLLVIAEFIRQSLSQTRICFDGFEPSRFRSL